MKDRQATIDIDTNWVPVNLILTSNAKSSEQSKLMANAFLEQRILHQQSQ
ncbi:MAG: hypothetical protein JW882_21205 [Deltaproteobacteria bacterium]|nr:hypothetical protein [Deltaproteobacteria bacterium]